MAFISFLRFIILIPVTYGVDTIECNDTSDNLTVTAQYKEITTTLNKNAVISAYVNYPKDAVTIQFIARGFENDMFSNGNCLYSVTIRPPDYSFYGINFEGTFDAKSSVRNQEATDVASVTVQVGTSITDNPSSVVEIKEYETHQINCSATGNPPPTLEWNLTNHGNNIKQDENFQTIPQYENDISSTTRLTIGSEYGARYNDSGEYQCFGNNTVGEDSKIVLKLSVHIPVELSNSSRMTEIKEGSSINISCDFRGFPKPSITWSDISYIASESVHDDIYTSSTLYITSSKCDDEGQFTCYATNTIVEDGEVNASGNVTVTFQDPSEVNNLIAKSNKCNGTFMIISWKPIDNWITELTYQIQYNSSDGESGVAETKDSQIIISTKPDSEYTVDVLAVSECKKTSRPSSMEIHTGIYLPSEPLNVTASENASICVVKWSEPDITYNNISQYTIYYEACNRDSGCSGTDISSVTCENLRSCEINMTEVNSEYYFNVSAENCAGTGAKAMADGDCSTDASATSFVTPVNADAIEGSQKNVNGTVTVSFEGFEVNIPEQSQENGYISCYYVIMVRYDKLYDASNQVQNRAVIDPNNLAAIADENAVNISNGQPYFSVASRSFGKVPVGDGSLSTCDISRSVEKKNYTALNRNLTADRSYDMFILTTVPSVKDPTKMYSQVSNATFIDVVESLPEGPENGDVPIAAIVVPIVFVVLIAAAGGGYWFYRNNKRKKTAKEKQIGSISYHQDNVSPYEQANVKSKTRVSPTPSED